MPAYFQAFKRFRVNEF